MKDIKVLIKANDLKELLSIPNLREILKLCQIWNTIRSAQRLLIKTEERSESPTKNRDIFYGLITTSSYVFEGIKTSDNILKKIAVILPKDKQKEIAWIHSEVSDSNSFYNTVIAKIRNNMGFHFNYSINDEQIKNVAVEFPLTFAQSTSEKKIDLVYLMADHLIAELPPFANMPDNKNKKEKEFEEMIINLGEYVIRFCDFLEEIISASYKQYLEIKE